MKGRSPPDGGPSFEAPHLPVVEIPSHWERLLAAMQSGASQNLLYLATVYSGLPLYKLYSMPIPAGLGGGVSAPAVSTNPIGGFAAVPRRPM